MQYLHSNIYKLTNNSLIVLSEVILVFLFLFYTPRILPKQLTLFAIFLFCALGLMFFLNYFIFRQSKSKKGIALIINILFLSILLFELFLKSPPRLINIILVFFVFAFSLSGLYFFWNKTEVSRNHYFEHEVAAPIFSSLAAIFFISYSLYAARIILSVSFLGTLSIFFLAFTVINRLNLTIWDLRQLSFRTVFALSTIIFLEIFFILGLSPISILARSAILVLVYYLFNGIIYVRSLPIFNKYLLKKHILISAFGIGLILLSANWL